MLRYGDVQRLLKVSRGTLNLLIEQEGLPVHRLTKFTHRFDLLEVQAWLRNRCSDRLPDGEDAA